MELNIWTAVVWSLLVAAVCSKANKHKPWIETEYQGIVMENDKTVLLNPPLFAIDKDAPLHYAGEICGFKIHGQGSAFEAVVLDRVTGEGVVRARTPLDCETQREHTFTIQAHDCGEDAQRTNLKRSHKAIVHVHVNDVNEFEPVFRDPLYEVTLTEGKTPDLMLRVEANDRDCSPQYSQICFYQILTPSVPFSIDNDGNIHSTEPLSVTQDGPYIFHVTAFDCGKKQAAKNAEIRVHVHPNCQPGWIGWSDRVLYPPFSGPRPLFPQIRLDTCGHSVWSIEAAVTLQTGHVAKGCDRDNYSERAQRRLCGASEDDVDLLPAPGPLSPWTSDLPSAASRDSSRVYIFNGTRAASVPPSALPSAPLADSFTLSFWMKRGEREKTLPAAQDREEAVICHTLLAENGYAHYALTLLGSRVTFVYWPQLGASRPIKFRWKLEQACDGEWHHYALSLQFPTVIFYVDGVTYEPALILDSGPFHPPRASPRLLIAACWNDGLWKETNNITDITFGTLASPPDRFLDALLSGVTLRAGAIDSREVLGCLYSCKEGLDFSDFDSLGKGMKVHINPSQTLLVLEGDDVENVNRAIEHVIYRNALRFATPGVRPFQLTTTVKCFSEEECVAVPPVRGVVEVLQPDGPRIALSGERHLARPASDYEGPRGVPLFPDLRVTCSVAHHLLPHEIPAPTTSDQDTLAADSFIHNLESCEILVLGDGIDAAKESLLLDLPLLQEKGLHSTNASSLLTISGVENIGVYETVLRGVRYRVEPGAALYERRFRLQCAEMNGRYVSNEFTVEVNVLHSLGSPARPGHLHWGQQFVHSARRSHHEMSGHRLADPHRHSVVPGAATVIVLVCVAFLVLMVTLGIFRIRSVQRPGAVDPRKMPEVEKEAFWEDSALTIIVNPMETYEQRRGSTEVAGGHDPVTPGLEAAANRWH